MTIFDNENHVRCVWRYFMNLEGAKYPAGGFESHLLETIVRADGDNLNRLSLGFPVHVEVYREWRETGEIE